MCVNENFPLPKTSTAIHTASTLMATKCVSDSTGYYIFGYLLLCLW